MQQFHQLPEIRGPFPDQFLSNPVLFFLGGQAEKQGGVFCRVHAIRFMIQSHGNFCIVNGVGCKIFIQEAGTDQEGPASGAGSEISRKKAAEQAEKLQRTTEAVFQGSDNQDQEEQENGKHCRRCRRMGILRKKQQQACGNGKRDPDCPFAGINRED